MTMHSKTRQEDHEGIRKIIAEHHRTAMHVSDSSISCFAVKPFTRCTSRSIHRPCDTFIFAMASVVANPEPASHHELDIFVQRELGAHMAAATLSCVFCKVPFKDMAHFAESRREVKVLDCLHLACGKCLQAILQKGKEAGTDSRPLCPLCDSQIKEGNYNKFLCHFAENQSLDFRAVGSQSAVISCDECIEAGPAVVYCNQCVKRLCAECSEHHRRSKASASHSMTKLKEQQEHSLHRAAMCATHPHRELEFFCETCNVMCCRDCITAEHETHVYKIPSRGLVEKQRKLLQDHIQQLRTLGSSLQERHQLLTNNIKVFEDELCASMQNIRTMETQVKEALEERKGQMLDEVESFRARQQQSFERRRASLASTMLTRWRAIDFLEKVLARGTNCEVLLLTGYISAQQLLGEDVLASKVAELALAAAIHPEQKPVSWSGDVAAASNAISKMTAAISWVRKASTDASSSESPGVALTKDLREDKTELAFPDDSPRRASSLGHEQRERLEDQAQSDQSIQSPSRETRERAERSGTFPHPGDKMQKISLADAVKAMKGKKESQGPSPQRISIFDALESTSNSKGSKVQIKRLGGSPVQACSDKEIREQGLGALRAVLGLEGEELGCFRSPCGMAIDSSRLFVADTLNCRIQVFSKFTLQPLGVIKLHDDCEVKSLSAPSGLCCAESDGQTTLIVVEYNLDRVLKLRLGSSLKAISAQELAPNTFYGPFGAYFSLGRVVVADSCNHRCLVLTLNGQVLFEFGTRGFGPGEFQSPGCVAAFHDGYIAVSDKDNHRIQVFDEHGMFHHFIPKDWTSFFDPMKPGSLLGPMGMCVDRHDRLFVADCGSDRVQIFSREGDFLWSSPMKPESATALGFWFQSPTAMAADDQGLVYVASDHCVQVF